MVFVKVPHAVPAQPVPATLHVTPWLLESLATVAVKFTVCPWSMRLVVAGATVTETTPAELTVREICLLTKSGVGAESVTFAVKVEVLVVVDDVEDEEVEV